MHTLLKLCFYTVFNKTIWNQTMDTDIYSISKKSKLRLKNSAENWTGSAFFHNRANFFSTIPQQTYFGCVS